MSVSWGTAAGSSSNEEKMGVEIYYTPYSSTDDSVSQTSITSTTHHVVLWVKYWVWTKYSFSDTQTIDPSITGSSWTTNWSNTGWDDNTGTISTPSDTSYSTSNKYHIKDYKKTFTWNAGTNKWDAAGFTSAASITVTAKGTMSGLYCSSSARPTKSVSITIPARQVGGYPTVEPASYDFSNIGSMYSFNLNGGSNYTVKTVATALQTTAAGGADSSVAVSSARSFTNTGSTYFLSFTDAERTAILNYWQGAPAYNTTAMRITVTTTVNGVDSSPTTVYVTMPTVSDLYSIASTMGSRTALSGTTSTSHTIAATVAASTASPWRQAGLWPSSILSVKGCPVLQASAATGAGAHTITCTGHTFALNDVVRVLESTEKSVLPNNGGNPITPVLLNETTYYVRNIVGSTFDLSTTSGGAAITWSSGGVAPFSVYKPASITTVMTYTAGADASGVYSMTDSSSIDLSVTKSYVINLLLNGSKIGTDVAALVDVNNPVLKLYKDSQTGEKRVGINMALPSATLDVNGSASVSGMFSQNNHIYEGIHLAAGQSVKAIIGVSAVNFTSNTYRYLKSGNSTTVDDNFNAYDNVKGLTVKVAGWYEVYGRVGFPGITSSPGTYRRLELIKTFGVNNESECGLGIIHVPPTLTTAVNIYLSTSALVYLNVGEGVRINAGHDAGASQSLIGNAAPSPADSPQIADRNATGIELHRIF